MNLYCAETLNIVLSFVIDVHFVMDVLIFSKMWRFPYPFGFCNPVWIYGRKINYDDDNDFRTASVCVTFVGYNVIVLYHCCLFNQWIMNSVAYTVTASVV